MANFWLRYVSWHSDDTELANMSYDKAQGPNDILELHLPNRNEFIPANLDVEKREVSEVRCHSMLDDLLPTLYQSLKDDLISSTKLRCHKFGTRRMTSSGFRRQVWSSKSAGNVNIL